jgi:hypothetical protein
MCGVKKGIYIKCPNCNIEFYKPLNSKKKFCTEKCARDSVHKLKIINVCIVCGENFNVHPCNKDQKCCSNQCATDFKKINDTFWKGNAIVYDKICLYCGLKFATKKESQKYCCKRCSEKDRIGKPLGTLTGIYKKCLFCENEFYVNNAQKEKIKFCSKKCYSNWSTGKEGNKKKTGFIKICEYCHKEFYVELNQSNYKFCCAKCGNMYRRGKLVFKKQTGIYDTCLLCNNILYTHNKKNKHFCSLSCWATYRHTHNMFDKISKPEFKFKDLLDKNNIIYIHQYYLKSNKGIKIYDFCIPLKKIFVEIDGIYWHSRDRNKALNEYQLKIIENDKLKNELATTIGYKVIRIWEDQIGEFNLNDLK